MHAAASRDSARQRVKRALARTWRAVATNNSARRVVCPILCYHSVNDVYDAHADPLPSQAFAEHVEHLAKHYTVVPLRRLVEAIEGRTRLPPRAVAITFDDGYVDNYENALPVLERFGVPATFFVVSGFIDGRVDLIGKARWRAMSWQQVGEIAANPRMDIGAHGVTHRKLSRLDAAEVAAEMRESRERIEQATRRKPELFAYPDGQGSDISPAARSLAADLGFAAALSTFWRTTHAAADRFMLRRVMVSSQDTVADLDMKLAGAYDFLFYVHKTKALLSVFAGRGGVLG